MQKLNFLPFWEIERRDKRKKTNLYVFLFILIFCNSVLFIFLIFNMNNIKKIKIEDTYKAIVKSKYLNDAHKQNEKKIDTLNTYQWYNKEINSNIILKNMIIKDMIIKDKGIILHVKVKDYNEYINIVGYMENKCRVTHVSVANSDQNYLEFSLTLEAKYE